MGALHLSTCTPSAGVRLSRPMTLRSSRLSIAPMESGCIGAPSGSRAGPIPSGQAPSGLRSFEGSSEEQRWRPRRATRRRSSSRSRTRVGSLRRPVGGCSTSATWTPHWGCATTGTPPFSARSSRRARHEGGCCWESGSSSNASAGGSTPWRTGAPTGASRFRPGRSATPRTRSPAGSTASPTMCGPASWSRSSPTPAATWSARSS